MQNKTQAQKREDREKRLAEQEASREAMRNAHVAAIQEQLQKQKQDLPPTVALSRKEQRKQKKAAAEQINTTEPSVTDKLAYLTTTTEDVEDQHKTDGKSLQEITKATEIQIPTVMVSIQHTNRRETEDRSSSTVVNIKEMAQIAINKEATNENNSSTRIVYNHSTHCPGLRPVLVKLQKYLPGATITPGKIASVANNAEEFELRFQRAESEGGFKFVARHGFTAQDVFITITDQVESPEEMVRAAVERVMDDKSAEINVSKAERGDDIPSSAFNRAVGEARNNLWREQRQKQDQECRERERAADKAKKIRERERKLVSKDIPASQVETYANRDETIVSGKERGKYSMSK